MSEGKSTLLDKIIGPIVAAAIVGGVGLFFNLHSRLDTLQTQFEQLPDRAYLIQFKNGLQADVLNKMPAGTVLPIADKTAQVPAGWRICDGEENTPDLKETFLMGVVSVQEIGLTGGHNEPNEAGAHTHDGQTDVQNGVGPGLPCSGNCVGRMPDHSHGFTTGEAGQHHHGGNRPKYHAEMFICKVSQSVAQG